MENFICNKHGERLAKFVGDVEPAMLYNIKFFLAYSIIGLVEHD